MAVELDVRQPLLLQPAKGEGETISDRAERNVLILVDEPQMTMTWTRYEAGEEGPDLHVHREHVDSFFVLEGELAFRLGPDGGETVRAQAGTLVAVPPNVVHTFANESDTRAVYLNFHTPNGGFADSLRARRDGRTEEAERWDNWDPPEDGGGAVSEVVICRPGEEERYERENGSTAILAELSDVSFIELVREDGWEGISPHAHDDYLDSFFVLEGEVDFTGAPRAAVGTLMAAPAGAEHGIEPTSGDVRLLNVHAPDAGFADRIRRQ
jgi:quercetin dioxygenase-like cupin family protein